MVRAGRIAFAVFLIMIDWVFASQMPSIFYCVCCWFSFAKSCRASKKKKCFDFDVTMRKEIYVTTKFCMAPWFISRIYACVYIRGIFLTLAERRLDDTTLLSTFELGKWEGNSFRQMNCSDTRSTSYFAIDGFASRGQPGLIYPMMSWKQEIEELCIIYNT